MIVIDFFYIYLLDVGRTVVYNYILALESILGGSINTTFYSKISLNEANGILSLLLMTLLYANGNGLPTILL